MTCGLVVVVVVVVVKGKGLMLLIASLGYIGSQWLNNRENDYSILN